MSKIQTKADFYIEQNTSQPTATVIVVTYNHEEYIAQCLDGILMQSVDFPYTVLVCDDCSTDKTRDVIDIYAEKYPNIIQRRYRKKNLGAGENGGAALKEVTSKYLFSCDGDDFWITPTAMQEKVDFLEKNPTVHLCSARYVAFYEHEKTTKIMPFNDILTPSQGFCFLTFKDILTWICGNASRNCYRVSAIKKYPEIPEYMTYDLYFQLIATNKGLAAMLFNVHSVLRANNKGIFSHKSYKEQIELSLYNCDKVIDFFDCGNKEIVIDYFDKLRECKLRNIKLIGVSTKKLLLMLIGFIRSVEGCAISFNRMCLVKELYFRFVTKYNIEILKNIHAKDDFFDKLYKN